MNIQEIKDYPTCIGNNHESLLQSYQLLKKVKNMLERGDSKETILEIIDFVQKPKEALGIKKCDHVFSTSKEVYNSDDGSTYAVCIKCLHRPVGMEIHEKRL